MCTSVVIGAMDWISRTSLPRVSFSSIGRFHSVRASFNEHQPPYGMLVFNDRQRNGALAYPFNDPRNYKTSLVKGLENRWFDRVSNTRIVYDRRRSVLFEFDVYARARVL